MPVDQDLEPDLAAPTGLPDLPQDIFLLIISHLEAWDAIRCRFVSWSWYKAFSEPEHLRIMLKKYPLAREVQQLTQSGVLNSPATTSQVDWQGTFDSVASRYFHLTHGSARSVRKHKLAIPEFARLAHWYAVSPWDYHESQPGGRLYHLDPLESRSRRSNRRGEKAYLFRPSFWSYDDGLLVFAPDELHDVSRCEADKTFALELLDLKTGTFFPVPFCLDDRIVRSFRLKDRTLIIEWAEQQHFHSLNESEDVHRHFATCYDVLPRASSPEMDTAQREWMVVYRSEWKLHFLGLPLSHRDRFFSTHTRCHYAIYVWQPNRSMYTGDEELPIESLSIWDISQPSEYLPHQDPAGRNKPAAGPFIQKKYSFTDLEHYSVRQHSSPCLMKLILDSDTCTISFRENVCVAGQGYFDPAERLWCARTTTFAFLGQTPHLRRQWDGNLPPYRGNCSMETVDVEEAENWFLGIMDVVDAQAKVRFSLVETVFTGQGMNNGPLLRISALGLQTTMDEETTKQISHMGRIAGDERFLVGQNDSQELVLLTF